MKITTKENSSGRITAYYVDGVRVRKCEIESLACYTNEVVEIEYYVAKQFHFIAYPLHNMKVVYTQYHGSTTLMTIPAALELGYLTGCYHSLGIYYASKSENPSADALQKHSDNVMYWKARN